MTDSKLKRHEPPGNLNDLTDANKDKWSKDYVSYWMDGEIRADPEVVGRGRTPLTQFFDGTQTAFDTTQEPQHVEWNGFPKLIRDSFPGEPLRWQIADVTRFVQDEYLEWSVNRGPRRYTGDIYSVTFTCEGPEYWQFFATYQREDFLRTVKELNSEFASSMDASDFFVKNPETGCEVYNPSNYWNLLSTNGSIVHLVQPNNTLSAEIDIAAQATVIRKDDAGRIITNPDTLINCSKYGNPGRNSDPIIGSTINSFARDGAILSVAEPVALYIRRFNTSNFLFDVNSTSDDAPPKNEDLRPIERPDEVFQWQRGNIRTGHGMRIKIEVPQGRLGKHGQQLLVSNIYDTANKVHIKYGAQFADYFTVGVSAVGKAGTAAPPLACYNPSAQACASVEGSCKQFNGFTRPGNVGGALGSSRA